MLKSAKLLQGTPMSHSRTAGVALLLHLARERLPEMQAQALANTLLAVSKLGVADPAFVNALISEARQKLPNFTPQNLTNTAYALANLGHENDAFLKVLLDTASAKLPDFDTANVIQMSFALSKGMRIKGHETQVGVFTRALDTRRTQLGMGTWDTPGTHTTVRSGSDEAAPFLPSFHTCLGLQASEA
jgi:hypothetical protein